MKPNHRTLILALAASLATALGTAALAQPKGEHPHHGHHHGAMKSGDCPHDGCAHGERAGAGECPMLSIGEADVTVENTKNGAVIRLAAKDPTRVADLQRAAASIAEHMGSHTAAGAPSPAARPGKP